MRFTRSVRTNSGCGEANKEDGSDEEEFDKEAFESGTMAGTGPLAGTSLVAGTGPGDGTWAGDWSGGDAGTDGGGW